MLRLVPMLHSSGKQSSMVEINAQDIIDKLKEFGGDEPRLNKKLDDIKSEFEGKLLTPLTGSHLLLGKIVLGSKSAIEAYTRVEHWTAQEIATKVTWGKLYIRLIELGAPQWVSEAFICIIMAGNGQLTPMDRLPDKHQRSARRLLNSKTINEFKANTHFLAMEGMEQWRN